MELTTTQEQGEINIHFHTPKVGKVSFNELGLSKNVSLNGGFFRMVFDFEGIGDHEYYKVPTIEIEYDQDVPDTLWQCEFNGEKLIEKVDHFGHSTVILLNRDKIKSLEQHHENKLILHAEFPESVQVKTEKSFINFFK